MQNNQDLDISAGWKGGFATTCDAFAYPNPDLSSLDLLGNMDNIPLLQRQQAVDCPEFSWETVLGDEKSRCFQLFAPYISRLGYTDEGRVYSIICPQQGACSPSLGCLNVEVTVTGQRGWVIEDEDPDKRQFAADMTVEGKIWFSPSALLNNWLTKRLWTLLEGSKQPFPFNKANAIRIPTFDPGNPDQPIFPIRVGESSAFTSPNFAKHPKSWAVGNLGVEIGTIETTHNELADDFNALIMEIFNLASGNMLKTGNVLTWNLWFKAPGLVNQTEWSTHAERWRESIDADHGSPHGNATSAKYFDGRLFSPEKEILEMEKNRIRTFLEKHFPEML
jgi:hypothetical protein